jgi:hypothetical protein
MLCLAGMISRAGGLERTLPFGMLLYVPVFVFIPLRGQRGLLIGCANAFSPPRRQERQERREFFMEGINGIYGMG